MWRFWIFHSILIHNKMISRFFCRFIITLSYSYLPSSSIIYIFLDASGTTTNSHSRFVVANHPYLSFFTHYHHHHWLSFPFSDNDSLSLIMVCQLISCLSRSACHCNCCCLPPLEYASQQWFPFITVLCASTFIYLLKLSSNLSVLFALSFFLTANSFLLAT